MRKHIVLLILFAGLIYPKVGFATTITFNEFAQGTVVDNEYLSIGLFFTASVGNTAQIVDVVQDGVIGDSRAASDSTQVVLPNGPNGLRVLPDPTNGILTVNFHPTFDLAVTGTASSFSFVSVSDVPTTSTVDNGTLRAFDIGGNLLAEVLSSVGGSSSDGVQGLETLAVMASNIAKVEISGFRDVIIDSINFEFSNTSVVPLPAALPLFGTGLAAMGFIGWRRKRKIAEAA